MTEITIGSMTFTPDAIPELVALRGVPQPERHHPEVDTFVHVMMVLEQARLLSAESAVHWAALLHDLGKARTPAHVLPSHHGHEEAGVPLVRAVSARMGVRDEWTDLAMMVCEHHTRCHRASDMSGAGLRRTLRRLEARERPERFELFLLACEADARGRRGFENRPYPQPEILRDALSRCET